MTIDQVNRYNSFEDVNNLEEAKINSLLLEGDEPEKVWAIWSLAIKKGESSAPELQSLCGDEPSPGVRRSLIVVLAGMHQSDLLYSLAKYDPDAFVRADALQYLIKTAPHNDILSKFLQERLNDDSENIVRIRVLKEAPLKLLTLSFNNLIAFIEPPSPELQIVSLEQLDKRVSIDDENASILAKLLLKEYHPNVLEKITSILFHAGKSKLILEAGMVQEDKTGFDLLTYLINQEVKFPWPSLQKFTDQKYGHNSHMIKDFIQNPTQPETFSWLSKRYSQMLELESFENDFHEIQNIFLKTLSEIKKPAQMSHALTSYLQNIHKHMKLELHDMQHDAKNEWMDDFYDEEEYEEMISCQKSLIEILENWLR